MAACDCPPPGSNSPISGPNGALMIPVITPTLYGNPLYGAARGVAVDQGTNSWINLPLMDPGAGGPLTISIGQYSTAPTVQVRYREGSGTDPCVYDPDTGDTPVLSTDGTSAYLPIPQPVRDEPGVYIGQMRVVDGNGNPVVLNEFTVLLQRSLWSTTGTATCDRGMPSFLEVRTAMRDYPNANRLIGGYEFSPGEVGEGIVTALQTFIAESPIVPIRLSTKTWPAQWRRQLIEGCLGYLFGDVAAAYFRRNDLAYGAGGIQVADLNKAAPYEKAAEYYREKFRQFAQLQKTRISIQASWGTLYSGIGNYGTL